MSKMLFVTAALLAPGFAYAGDPSADLSVQVVPAASTQANFTVTWGTTYQTIDGFGASDSGMSGWNEIGIDPKGWDMLYCVNATDPGCSAPGIGLTFLRRQINIGQTPGSQFFYNAQQVANRGGTIWATPWYVNPDPSTYSASAQSEADFISAHASNGVTVYGVTPQNEPVCGCNGGVVWGTGQTIAYIDVLAPKIHALGAKVIAAEDYSYDNAYINAIKGDSTANSLVDIFSWHQYAGAYTSGDTTRHGWETEMSTFNDAFDPSLSYALNNDAQWIWNVIVNGSMHAWHRWYAVTPYNYGNATVNNLGLLGDGNGTYAASDVNPTKRYYVVGNFSRFVRPGWVRIDVSGSLSGIYGVTAFKNPTTGAFAIIAINNSGSDIQNISFSLSGGNISGSITPYVTSGTALGSLGTDGNLSAGSASSNVPSSISVNGNAFTSTVPYGVTTFVGQTR